MDSRESELVQEELGTEEMRLLLDRISHEELGGSGMSTLADVAEATGTPINVLTGMLADIRDVPELHQRLAAQEKTLEEQRQEIELLKRGRKGLFNLQYQEFKELEKAHEIEKNKYAVPLFVVILAVMILVSMFQKPPTPPVLPKPNPHGLFSNFASGSNGELYKVEEYPRGKYTYTVEYPDGTKRQMTNYEKDLYPQLDPKRSKR